MNKRSAFFAITFLLLIIFITYAVITMNYPDNCKSEIKKRFTYHNASTKESYLTDCANETRKDIHYPLVPPAYVKVHFDNILFLPKTLSKNNMDSLISILDDSASYQWGESGAPYFDRYFTFHDSSDACIGYTDFSFKGQTMSTPSLAKMKWGMLTDKARKGVIYAIEN